MTLHPDAPEYPHALEYGDLARANAADELQRWLMIADSERKIAELETERKTTEHDMWSCWIFMGDEYRELLSHKIYIDKQINQLNKQRRDLVAYDAIAIRGDWTVQD